MKWAINPFPRFFSGFQSVLSVAPASMLYRYPYRVSGEGLKSDWKKVSEDIAAVIAQVQQDKNDGQI